MSNNGNIDIELLAGLDINSSEQEIRRAIAIIQSRLRGNNAASIKIDANFDDKAIKDTLNCILRSWADSDAFQSGRYADHNEHSKTLAFLVKSSAGLLLYSVSLLV